MSVLDRLAKFAGFQRIPATQTRAPRSLRLPTGGRVSNNEANEMPYTGGWNILSQLSADEYWRDNLLDGRTLDRVPVHKLMELLCELSPEISAGYWYFILLCNSGWEVSVTRQGGKAEDAQGKALVDDFLRQLAKFYGSANVPIDRLFASLFLRGEVVAELVLGADGRMMHDLATPDPRQFDFEKRRDDLRGFVDRFGQWQGGSFVTLEGFDTIQYVPLNPLPGKPRGMGCVGPALFSSLFLIAILHDLRRVVAQQGWPRMDLEMNLEKLAGAFPDLEAEPQKFREAVDQTTRDVITAFGSLEPDDAYVHTDVVKVNRPVGTVDASSLGAIDGVIQALERMTARALKMMPLLLGLDQTNNEGQANRQWEIQAAGVKKVQHLVEDLLSNLLQVGLRANGRLCDVKIKFAEIRAAEMLRDAQTEALKIRNEREKFAAGWTSQDEASQVITGHDAVEAQPRQSATSAAGNGLANVQPDPGANRGARILALANEFALSGNRNATALALLLSAAADEPVPSERQAAEDWWNREAGPDVKALMDAEVIQ